LLAAIVEHRHAGFDRYVDTADAGEIPLYRMWNSFGDSNHRFTPRARGGRGNDGEGLGRRGHRDVRARLVTRRA